LLNTYKLLLRIRLLLLRLRRSLLLRPRYGALAAAYKAFAKHRELDRNQLPGTSSWQPRPNSCSAHLTSVPVVGNLLSVSMPASLTEDGPRTRTLGSSAGGKLVAQHRSIAEILESRCTTDFRRIPRDDFDQLESQIRSEKLRLTRSLDLSKNKAPSCNQRSGLNLTGLKKLLRWIK